VITASPSDLARPARPLFPQANDTEPSLPSKIAELWEVCVLHWPVEPMRAAAVRNLPDLPHIQDPRFELKWDGWRCLAWVGRDGVELQSRQGKSLAKYFPDVCRALAAHIPAGVLLDGELLTWDDGTSRTSFTHLQKRITAGRRLNREIALRPAHLVLFDVLRDSRGRSLLNEPFDTRRRRLQRLLKAAPPQLVLCPQTADIYEAGTWLADTAVAGIEGLVVKAAASKYIPGKAGWIKVKNEMNCIGRNISPARRPSFVLVN
jgi:ATP-dependent DNA ligase